MSDPILSRYALMVAFITCPKDKYRPAAILVHQAGYRSDHDWSARLRSPPAYSFSYPWRSWGWIRTSLLFSGLMDIMKV